MAIVMVLPLYLLALLLVFWVIRLGVRYGVDDALQKNSAWLRRSDADDTRVN